MYRHLSGVVKPLDAGGTNTIVFNGSVYELLSNMSLYSGPFSTLSYYKCRLGYWTGIDIMPSIDSHAIYTFVVFMATCDTRYLHVCLHHVHCEHIPAEN